jgi:hypothetical protein
MRLVIDTKECDRLGLTVIELAYLHCKYNNLLDDFNYDMLCELGYLDDQGHLTEGGRNLIAPSVSEEMLIFVRVYDLYPHKLGTRVLKAKSIDSGDGKHCLSKYRMYLRQDSNVGDKMLRGLSNEITLRKKGNSEQFFQDIRTWFNQQTWDKYADLDVTPVEDKVERI